MVEGKRKERAYEKCPKVPSKRRWLPTLGPELWAAVSGASYKLGSARGGACLRQRPTSRVICVFGSLNLGEGKSLSIRGKVSMAAEVEDEGTEAAYDMRSGCVCEDE